MDSIAPPHEQLSKFEYEAPALDQNQVRYAWRKVNGFEKIKRLEPEHRQAVIKLEIHYYGAQGVNVAFDDESRALDRYDTPDEFSEHRHRGLLEMAKNAVGSPRTWKALICQVEDTLSAEAIGRVWFGIQGRQQAKGIGEGLIIAGLDALVMHWGLISQPPNR